MPEIKTILITGGAGFIGSNLCQYFVDKSYHVICLDNFDDFYLEEIKLNNIYNLMNNELFQLFKGDIRDEPLLNNIFSKFEIETVIHLASKAGVRNSLKNPNEYFDVNVNGSICLFEVMKKHNVINLIFSSSSSVYGNKSGKLIETDKCNNQISPYAVSKKTVELLNYNYHINYSFNVINLRLFSIYGDNQRPDLVLHKFFNNIQNHQPIEVYGSTITTRDYTHILDVANAFYSALCYLNNANKSIYEIINIGNGNPVSLKKLIEYIKLNNPNKNIEILKKESVKGDAKNTNADIQKAKRLLNYNPTIDIINGIDLFYDWFKIKYNKNSNA